MQLIKLKRKSKKLRSFNDREWAKVHPAHYGNSLDKDYWARKNIVYKAVENKEIVGSINCDCMAGVLHIKELIIDENHRGKGIGKALLAKAEADAIKLGMHIAYLETGRCWPSIEFYTKRGYKISVEIPKFYDKTDFVFMTKELTA